MGGTWSAFASCRDASETMNLPDTTSFSFLLDVTKQACDELAVFVRAVYDSLSGDSSDSAKMKDDKSLFTIADGIVQETLKSCLFGGGKFEALVGEEDSSNINILEKPYRVDNLVVREELNGLIDQVRERLSKLGETIDANAYKNVSVFIDPIDGTREFCTKLGEQCSICIGFSVDGKPVAGIVYRPIPNPATWAAGCKSENQAFGALDLQVPPHANGLLTSNGGISPFIVELMKELNFERVPSGGAGNKMLMVLEGKGTCYIQDRGVSRWDTCAAQAVLEAYGGALVKLHNFVEKKELESYTYRKSNDNADFVAGLSSLTPYNSRVKGFAKGAVAENVEMVLPYSNLSGLFAMGKSELERSDFYFDAIGRAKAKHLPSYD
jgi:3'-phosphoadenosine 5'-phosphosulfate (PAPS) 3'-phosphatase